MHTMCSLAKVLVSVNSSMFAPPPALPQNPSMITSTVSDPKLKRYEVSVDKLLSSFESITEWADIISFLARLIKTLSAFPEYSNIPNCTNVSKRLAQCLNPSLPAGVHQKALEAYDLVFRKISSDSGQEFVFFTSGLFPFFEHASLNVKTSLIRILKEHILPRAKSAMFLVPNMMLALLSTMEDHNNEHYDEVWHPSIFSRF